MKMQSKSLKKNKIVAKATLAIGVNQRSNVNKLDFQHLNNYTKIYIVQDLGPQTSPAGNIEFLMRNPNLRSKIENSSSRGEKITSGGPWRTKYTTHESKHRSSFERNENQNQKFVYFTFRNCFEIAYMTDNVYKDHPQCSLQTSHY